MPASTPTQRLTATGEIQMLPGHTNWAHGVAFSPDGKWIASASHDGTVKIWKTPPPTLPDPTGGVQCVAFHPKDDRLLGWGTWDATVKVGNWATKQIRTLHGHMSWVESVAFSPDGKWIASASLDGTVKLWSPPLVPNPAALK